MGTFRASTNHPGESRTSPRRLSAAERQVQALELRKSGLTYGVIAQRLGYANEAGARKAVETALQKTIQEPSDELRRLEVERLDAMLSAIWHFVMAGSDRHVSSALRIMERKAALLGLDAAKTINISHLVRQEAERVAAAQGLDVGEVMAELEAILAEASA